MNIAPKHVWSTTVFFFFHLFVVYIVLADDNEPWNDFGTLSNEIDQSRSIIIRARKLDKYFKTMRTLDVLKLIINLFVVCMCVLTCKRILRSFSCNKHLREDMG